MSGTICFPKEIIDKQEVDCPSFVSTYLRINNQKSNMFPDNIVELASNISKKTILGSNLLGLTVNNGTGNYSLEKKKIKLTFNHKTRSGCQDDTQKSRSCVWWDESLLNWSGSGCSLSLEETNDTVTVCYCNHLTNFGIMFDYMGEAEPGDLILSILSWVLLITSSIAILITQILLFFDKVKIDIHTMHLDLTFSSMCLRDPNPRLTF